MIAEVSEDITSHFSHFLRPRISDTKALCQQVFEIRHEVYCSELGFFDTQDSGLETDEFDINSILCLIEHISSEQYAGTVRIVLSHSEEELLPIERFCMESIEGGNLHPKNFPRHSICEISRLAIPKKFRRRTADEFTGSATGEVNKETYSEVELRCFPFIAMSLYLSATAICNHRHIEHCFVMMEPRLARRMSFVGFKFKQIGKVVEYNGRRAPYYIHAPTLINSLSADFKKMLECIMLELELG